MPTEEQCSKELKTEIAILKKQLSEVYDKNDILKNENYSLNRTIENLRSEKDKLLAIIDNLSKGFAVLGDRK